MLKKIAETLNNQKSAVIITHVNPDGDALGSSFGLKYALESKGISADVVLPSSIAPRFDFIGFSPVLLSEYTGTPDCVICVDFGDVSRCGDCAPLFEKAGTRIVIDHHITKEKICDLHYTDTSAAATCEIIASLLKELDISLTKKIAEPVYMGIMTDSGCMRFGNTTKNTLLSAAELISFVDVSYLNRMIFDIKSKEEFEIHCKLLPCIKEYAGGKIHWLAVSLEDCKNEDAISGLVNDALNIEGTRIGVLFKERDDGTVKASVRSEKDINVAELCGRFGGGGHINAAGCTLNGSLTEAVNVFLKEAEKII